MRPHTTSQVLIGLQFLHQQGVLHRDIKGGNLLVAKDGVVKLADFGVASLESDKATAMVGSPYWMAPEVIEMAGAVTAAADIWALGCTVVELVRVRWLPGRANCHRHRPCTSGSSHHKPQVPSNRSTVSSRPYTVPLLLLQVAGSPPYYDLPPMTALFRIVQDEAPPLPETVSPVLREVRYEAHRRSVRSHARLVNCCRVKG